MGKHDNTAHNFHIPKKMKFSQPKPTQPTNTSSSNNAPHQPKVGTNARNQFR